MTRKPDEPKMILGIVTDIHHWRDEEGRLCSFGPYIREIDVWNRMFRKTIIAGALGRGPMPDDCLPYASRNIEFIPVFNVPGNSFQNRLSRLVHVPDTITRVRRVIGKSDIVHLRTPSFSSLLALLLLPFTKKPRIAKWAGLFEYWHGEPWTSRMQRRLLQWGVLGGPVMVYGEHNSPHLVPFFPAAVHAADLELMKVSLDQPARSPREPVILLVGRLVEAKGFDLAIKALSRLLSIAPSLPWRAVVVGGGRMQHTLTELALAGGIEGKIDFVGSRPFKEVISFYRAATILLMPGQKEGFSKVLIEACASRTIPVSTDVGLSPWILDYGRRGILCRPDSESMAKALLQALTLPEGKQQEMFARGLVWVRDLTLEEFEKRLRSLLVSIGADCHGC